MLWTDVVGVFVESGHSYGQLSRTSGVRGGLDVELAPSVDRVDIRAVLA